MRSSTSQTLELLLLQDPQQLGLQRQRHISDFVQEQSPTVSHFKAADFLRKGPSKRAFFVAEEFAFQQVKGNRRAIELYERSSAALAGVMDGPGDQLLARTRLSKNQDRGISWRNDFHKLQRLFEGKAGAHHFYSQRTQRLSYIRHSRVRLPYRYFLHCPLSLARVILFGLVLSNHKCKHSPAKPSLSPPYNSSITSSSDRLSPDVGLIESIGVTARLKKAFPEMRQRRLALLADGIRCR